MKYELKLVVEVEEGTYRGINILARDTTELLSKLTIELLSLEKELHKKEIQKLLYGVDNIRGRNQKGRSSLK